MVYSRDDIGRVLFKKLTRSFFSTNCGSDYCPPLLKTKNSKKKTKTPIIRNMWKSG
jgi:hypothetical protein